MKRTIKILAIALAGTFTLMGCGSIREALVVMWDNTCQAYYDEDVEALGEGRLSSESGYTKTFKYDNGTTVKYSLVQRSFLGSSFYDCGKEIFYDDVQSVTTNN